MTNYNTFPFVFPFQFGTAQVDTSTSSFTISYGATEYNIEMPDSIIESSTKNIQNLVFNDGTAVELDRGKTGDSLTLSGSEISSATENMEGLNTFMDNQRIITVTNLPDSNLNTDYLISELNFSQEGGEKNLYMYNITLERIHDRL